MALSQYTLVAFNRDSAVSAEAAMKYFVLGAIASGTLLYGISLLYGITGTLQLDELAARVGAADISVPALLALAFIIVGVAFKFGAVPFHMWLPDVYQGAPTPVTLFIGSVPKLASFALVWRVLSEGLGPLHDGGWRDMLIVLCVLSLGIGNLVAIAQTNIKRMLAYSTISHVGFIFMGFIAGNDEGLSAAMFYTFAYVLMAAAAFGMVILLSRRGFEAERLEDFKGLNARSPWFALVMLMIMFSMAGVPPFVGFYAKLVVLQAVLDAGPRVARGRRRAVRRDRRVLLHPRRLVHVLRGSGRRDAAHCRGGHAHRHQRQRARLARAGLVPRRLARSLRARARRVGFNPPETRRCPPQRARGIPSLASGRCRRRRAALLVEWRL